LQWKQVLSLSLSFGWFALGVFGNLGYLPLGLGPMGLTLPFPFPFFFICPLWTMSIGFDF
ncbi:hypothetical protein, partial [Vibrio vulnificus]|uniref:hypothetical protein n=1 Tax=Vibrio vulnificus TaxID=672 RepID=UPI0019D4B629